MSVCVCACVRACVCVWFFFEKHPPPPPPHAHTHAHDCNVQGKLRKKLTRLIVAYGGQVDAYMQPGTTHVVTRKGWDAAFDEAARDKPGLVFVTPQWISKCQALQAKVDTRPFRIARR